MKYNNIREEALKIKVAQDYFWLFDCSNIIGNVDFCVTLPKSNKGINPLVDVQSLLWAEAKRGSANIYKSMAQLILTIGKARTFDKYLPPAFLGVFDYEKIVFIPYSEIHDIFYLNDFNWNVAPSNYETREFKMILEKAGSENFRSLQFNYIQDDAELKKFIKTNFADNKFGLTKIKIDKNNFLNIYYKWLETVKPTIQEDWEEDKKIGIIDADFYLADLISAENRTLKDKLSILLKTDLYELNLEIPNVPKKLFTRIGFSDNQKAHTQFWVKYERPPLEDYWDYFLRRRDLLVPQDVRERKGSFYTPRIWVELSQQYLAEVLGENWQEEYYVWDCCAGIGNLLVGLTNKYHIYASTLDKADVDVMKDRIQNGANLLESHVFQFDFLNDEFTKLPQSLQDIINDEKKRKKLVIYINPPYAEAATADRQGNKMGVSDTKTKEKYKIQIGNAVNELFAQFLIRIYYEIPSCLIANFSTLKNLQSANFTEFRTVFKPKLKKLFLIPANTFDNVKGKFPIGFFIWDSSKKEKFSEIKSDVFEEINSISLFSHKKTIYNFENKKYINSWYKNFYDNKGFEIGIMNTRGNDFQNQNYIYISTNNNNNHTNIITEKNLISSCIYFAVRKVIPATWLNDRDQFLYPNDGWKTDLEFQNDCLAYTLFHNSNNIQSKYGINHWIPFTEYDVSPKKRFKSRFMTEFIKGDIEPMASEPALFFEGREYDCGISNSKPKEFSSTARMVFSAGKKLWQYYHKQQLLDGYNVNASLYDIREHFQGRNEKKIMNNSSKDQKYNELLDNLREALKTLAQKIEPKVYEYGFLLN